ncbi:MAG: DUF456 domain-containing protein [Verrucomicrobia bacterium]|nr:MAG: DUF456 domain-containing protein [Verrucomicrobiota bacterium]
MVAEVSLQVLAWSTLVLGMVLGVVFVFLPVIPGPLLIVLGAIVHKLLLPDWLSWWMIGALGVLAVLERVADFVGTMAGAKWMGATKWGILGAVIGGVVGLFFGIIGIFVGPVIGAAVGEWLFARRHPKESMKAGVGAGVGVGVSTVVRLGIALGMAFLVVVDLFWNGA